ncbi:hypothetical protein GCM10022407_34330 [Hymenobacter antarcticus]|uniref:Uncharacterized protein n=1 Tax=Hymenobacter antarcticus TaxID=486270 RepID=A0ABP7QRN4_9BACT
MAGQGGVENKGEFIGTHAGAVAGIGEIVDTADEKGNEVGHETRKVKRKLRAGWPSHNERPPPQCCKSRAGAPAGPRLESARRPYLRPHELNPPCPLAGSVVSGR